MIWKVNLRRHLRGVVEGDGSTLDVKGTFIDYSFVVNYDVVLRFCGRVY